MILANGKTSSSLLLLHLFLGGINTHRYRNRLGGDEGRDVATKKREIVSFENSEKREERKLDSLDNDLLELSIELRGHLTLSNISEELLLGRLKVVLEL